MFKSFLKPFYNDLKTLILDTLFPIYCLVCETEGQKFICDNCPAKLTALPQQFCIVCQKASLGGLTHPKCHSPRTADGLISLYDYQDEKVSNILIKGKYSFLPQVYQELGLLAGERVQKSFPHVLAPNPGAQKPMLTPIPLHKWRQNWRGFNQSEILAETLSKNLSSSCASVLVRCKFTRTQKNLKKAARIKNLEGAFKLQGGAAVQNTNFILVDDVTTTGQTLLEAAKVLKQGGAKMVWCLTIARD